MKSHFLLLGFALLLTGTLLSFAESKPSAANTSTPGQKEIYLSPTALETSCDGKALFVACATANQIAVFDLASGKISRTIPVPESPLGLALSPDGALLYVTCAAPESRVCIVDVGDHVGCVERFRERPQHPIHRQRESPPCVPTPKPGDRGHRQQEIPERSRKQYDRLRV